VELPALPPNTLPWLLCLPSLALKWEVDDDTVSKSQKSTVAVAPIHVNGGATSNVLSQLNQSPILLLSAAILIGAVQILQRISLELVEHTMSSSSSSPPQGSSGNGRGGINRQGTYAGQSSLPRLPIPTLEETLARFPTVVSALLTSSKDKDSSGGEMAKCLQEIQHFLQTDGPVLQELLVEYDRRGREDGTVGSFVEEFWSDAYLAPDSSVVMNLNPFFVLEVGHTA
jgi:hypothetical protein